MYVEKSKYFIEKLDLSDVNKEEGNDNLMHLEYRKINNHNSVNRHDSIQLLKYLSKKFIKTSTKFNHADLDKIFNSNLFPKKKYFQPKIKMKKLTPFQKIINKNKENKKITEFKQNNSLKKLNFLLKSSNDNYLNTKFNKENNLPYPTIHSTRIYSNPYLNYKSFPLTQKKKKNNYRTLSLSISKNSTSLENYENKKKQYKTLKLLNNKGFKSVNFAFNLNPFNYQIIHRKKNKVNSYTEI